MKNETILLGIALIIFSSLFTSCQKENIAPTATKEFATNNLSTNTSIITLTDPDLKPISVLSFPITIVSTNCPTGGYNLTVSSPDVDISNGTFSINWYKNTEQQIYSNGLNVDCVCGFGLRVEIIDDTGLLVADSSIDIPGC
ncbi:hypothetical protein OAU10_03985 [Saprospiraceae bacterium]|nr:hypothetical protein [Saprospiraceae bacterium]